MLYFSEKNTRIKIVPSGLLCDAKYGLGVTAGIADNGWASNAHNVANGR